MPRRIFVIMSAGEPRASVRVMFWHMLQRSAFCALKQLLSKMHSLKPEPSGILHRMHSAAPGASAPWWHSAWRQRT